MGESLKKIQLQFNEFWEALDKRKKITLIIVLALVICGIVILGVSLGKEEYVVLYSGLELKEAGEITQKLDEMQIKWKSDATGTTIYVPKEQEGTVRMQLSTQGYPASGFNYDMFFQNIEFGTTDYEKRKIFIFQLQDRLENSIKTINGVKNAVVTINMQEEDDFVIQTETQPTTASVLLDLEQGVELEANQIKGIEELVAKSVKGLQPENITIIDSNANILTAEARDDSGLITHQLALEEKVHSRLQKQLLDLLQPVFGHDRVLVAVNVKLDFDKQSTESIRFEPVVDDEGIIVSIQDLREHVNSVGAAGVPGADANADPVEYPEIEGGDSEYQKRDRIINYEVNEIKEQIEKAQGQIKDLSVSIVIDEEVLDAQGEEKVRELVAMACGIDEELVSVQGMPFSTKSLEEQIRDALDKEDLGMRETTRNFMYIGGIILLVIIGIVVVRRVLKGKERELDGTFEGPAVEETAAAVKELQELDIQEDEKAEIRKQLDRFIDQKPEAVAQLLRTWLSED
ncbi:MAG TPA: flagellar M-ring protein FliF [Clostridiales bacterium]|nr:flagellar M-ring protein FliF [Clostridiales bacterium]